jgi:hypothetical protein
MAGVIMGAFAGMTASLLHGIGRDNEKVERLEDPSLDAAVKSW